MINDTRISRTALLVRLGVALAVAALCLALAAPDAHAVRIKDICTIEGVRENQLVGYGLVVGLDDAGDDMGTGFTQQSLVGFVRRHNINISLNDVDVGNVAAVVVTATLPPFARQGSKIDVTVSSLGDAENLHGGMLVATALRPVGAAPNDPRTIYAIAQGPVSTGGFAAGGAGASVTKNHPTTAVIPGGGIIEQTVETSFQSKPEINLVLRTPDFTTASRIAQIINSSLGATQARAVNAATITVGMPVGDPGQRVEFLSKIEGLEVSPDAPAVVVYNERTGTIVMNANVRISKAIVAHGNLTLRIEEQKDITAGAATDPFGGQAAIIEDVSRTRVETSEERGEFRVLEEGVTIGEVAKALNALGVTSRDIISIMQALRQNGALQADLKPM